MDGVALLLVVDVIYAYYLVWKGVRAYRLGRPGGTANAHREKSPVGVGRKRVVLAGGLYHRDYADVVDAIRSLPVGGSTGDLKEGSYVPVPRGRVSRMLRDFVGMLGGYASMGFRKRKRCARTAEPAEQFGVGPLHEEPLGTDSLVLAGVISSGMQRTGTGKRFDCRFAVRKSASRDVMLVRAVFEREDNSDDVLLEEVFVEGFAYPSL